jgi:hypothetical protein
MNQAQIRVHKLQNVTRRLEIESKAEDKREEIPGGGQSVSRVHHILSAQFQGSAEVHLDLNSVRRLADKAMGNKSHKAKSGPIVVRVYDLKEVPGTRQQT